MAIPSLRCLTKCEAQPAKAYKTFVVKRRGRLSTGGEIIWHLAGRFVCQRANSLLPRASPFPFSLPSPKQLVRPMSDANIP